MRTPSSIAATFTLGLALLAGCSSSPAGTAANTASATAAAASGATSNGAGSSGASHSSSGSPASTAASSTATTSGTSGATATSSGTATTSSSATATAAATSSSSSSGTAAGGSSGTASSSSSGAPLTCGTCPSGYACGTANGQGVCLSTSTGIPLFNSVIVIMMENVSWSTLQASTNTPFIHSLETTAAYSTAYHGVDHPSLPNYIALISGSEQGVGCDCTVAGSACNAFTCNLALGDCGCPQTAPSMAEELDAAGVTWRGYAESMGTPCSTTDTTDYAQRHMPFVYFSDVTTDAGYCDDRVVDYSNFFTDLTAGTRKFDFIAPNLTNDMHNPAYPNNGPQNLANGDTWLSHQMPSITASSAYQNGGLVVVVWDEDDDSGGLTGTDDPIGMFVISRYAKAGYASSVMANHYSLLATIEDGLNMPRLGMAAAATPFTDFFTP